ncbi:MAG: hypothetical protein IJS89_05830 [Bacteroidaceae bacterium]|nr:hypothetical protein [Bacteroidaceae bacterium]
MWVLLLMLLTLGIFAALLGLRRTQPRAVDTTKLVGDDEDEPAAENCNACAAEGTGCYAERMLRHAAQTAPQYFEDEELDRFAGTPAGNYSTEQAALFAEVLRTLRAEEVADWLHALTLRGIELPASLRDEAILLMQG